MKSKKSKKLLTRKYSGGGDIAGGLVALASSMAGAYGAADHNDYSIIDAARARAKLVGNTNIMASDARGMLEGINSIAPVMNLSYQDDVDKSSAGTTFTDMFTAGLMGQKAGQQIASGVSSLMSSYKKPLSSKPIARTQMLLEPLSEIIKGASTRGELLEAALSDAVSKGNPLEASYLNTVELAAKPEDSLSFIPTYTPGTEGSPYYLFKAMGGPMNRQFAIGGNMGMIDSAVGLGTAGLTMMMSGLGAKAARDRGNAMIDNLDYLNEFALERQNQTIFHNVGDYRDNTFNMQAIQSNANGGDLMTQGAVFSMPGGFNIIGNGGTHEANPQDGVPQGISVDGKQNLVELDEVIWNDYVFSNRLTIPKKVQIKYDLKKDMSYADAAKKLTLEAQERPNDPISQNTVEMLLGDLKESQEEVRMQKEAAKIRRQISKMSPQELIALQGAMEENQQPMQQAPVIALQPMELPMELEPVMQANGGHLFADGGGKSISETVFEFKGKKYKVTPEFTRLFKNGDIQISVDASGNIVGKRAPVGYKYSVEGPLVKVSSGSVSGSTVTQGSEDLTGQYVNKGNFMENGQLNPHRMDMRKTEQQVRQREEEDLYTKTNDYIRQLLANYVAGVDKDLSKVDPKLIAKLKEVDNQFTRGSFDDKDRLFDSNGNLRKDVLDVLLDRGDGKGGLRTDGKEGPNHWSADWFSTPEETPYELNWAEYEQPKEEGEVKLEDEKKGSPLSTWMRYAPIFGSLLGVGNSMFERAKDYSTSVTPRLASYTPIGDYLRFNPIDTQRYLNAENLQAAAQRNAIMNSTGANRNMAMALMALANQLRLAGINQILNEAEAMNFTRLALVGEFNRGTNMFNADAFNKASMQNTAINDFNLKQELQNLQMRYRVNSDIDEAKGENLSQLFNNLGNLGKDNLAHNQVASNPALYYGYSNPLIDGFMQYMASKQEDATKDNTKKTTSSKYGGMLTKKNNRRK